MVNLVHFLQQVQKKIIASFDKNKICSKVIRPNKTFILLKYVLFKNLRTFSKYFIR